jgi:DNA-directed RNA polymerase specialized sigma24 family protein
MEEEFELLVANLRPRLLRAFVAAYGPDRGQEALAEALAHAWERRDAVLSMANPGGYLFRVGQSKSRSRRQPVVFPDVDAAGVPWIEPALPAALNELTEHQRVAVVLSRAYGWTYPEIGALLGIAPTTVQNHVERAMTSLRARLKVMTDEQA